MQVDIALSTFLLLFCYQDMVAETQSWIEFWNLIISLKKSLGLSLNLKTIFSMHLEWKSLEKSDI